MSADKKQEDAFRKWIKTDIEFNDKLIEDKIMHALLQEHSAQATQQKAINKSVDIIVVSYSILAFAAVGLCLYGNTAFPYFEIQSPQWNLVMNDPDYTKYYVLIIVSGILSIISLTIHALSSKNISSA